MKELNNLKNALQLIDPNVKIEVVSPGVIDVDGRVRYLKVRELADELMPMGVALMVTTRP